MYYIYRLAATTEVAALVRPLAVSEQIVQAQAHAEEAVDATADLALAHLAVVLADRACFDGVVPFSS
jgi:hypothetical protein